MSMNKSIKQICKKSWAGVFYTKVIRSFLHKKFSKSYWKSNWGTRWHNDRLKDNQDCIDFSDCIYENVKNQKFDLMIEIGCGAGNLMQPISQKMINSKKFIGIDINKKQIKVNIERYQHNDNIEFVCTDIQDYISNTNFDNVLIVSQNTLDYFEVKHLESLFFQLYNHSDNVTIAVSTHKEYLSISEKGVEVKEHNFTVYKHNYDLLLKEAGYKTSYANIYKEKGGIVVFAYKS